MIVRFFEKALTFLFDIIAFNVAFASAFWIRYKSGIFPETYNPTLDFSQYLTLSVILTAGWVVLFFFTGLYRTWYKESRLDEFFVVVRTILIGIFLLFLVTSASQIIDFATSGDFGVLFTRTKFTVISTYAACIIFFATVVRFALHSILVWVLCRGIGVSNVLIVGAHESGMKLCDELTHYPHLGFAVKGFIDDDGRKKGTLCGSLPVLGTYSDIPAVVKKEHSAGLIISHVSGSPNEILKIVNYCGDLRLTIHLVPSLMDVISGHLKTHQVFGVPLILLLSDHMSAWEEQIKRIIDVAISFLVLVAGAPLWFLVAALIRLGSPGPVIYNQERIGRNGKPFIMHKFRSMYNDAEARTGPKWAGEKDPRVTPVGRFLRTTRTDEIPQFFNVLKGQMSLVGPRPERAFFIEQLKQEIPWYVRRIKMRPGITGWAQVKHKYDSSIEDVRQKVIYDLYYFENMSILLDLKIMLRTFLVVVTGRGAH
jgi:exopolysaccharide biosynthesis polyprenyl glycosylphosphotransferase